MAYRNYQQMLRGELEYVLNRGLLVNGTREVLHRTSTVELYNERFLLWPARKQNPFAIVAETLWTLMSMDDIRWLERYLPRAKEFSDNGQTWRAAYGPRLFQYQTSDGYGTIDQVQKAITHLNKHNTSRQAVLTIWQPELDLDVRSKDVPCNNWVSFQVRNDTLHTAIAIRSWDLMWGSAVDTYFWSVLHEVVANSVAAFAGPITYFVSSEHLYERHFERAKQMLAQEVQYHSYDNATDYPEPPLISLGYERLKGYLNDVFRLEHAMRVNVDNKKRFYEDIEDNFFEDAWLHDCVCMLATWNAYRNGADNNVIQQYINIMACAEMKVVATEYFVRRGVFSPLTKWYQRLDVSGER